MANHAIGHAIMIEILTQIIYSRDSIVNISMDFAPFAFLILISFVLSSVLNAERPISPKLSYYFSFK
jgi:hypothetical protein